MKCHEVATSALAPLRLSVALGRSVGERTERWLTSRRGCPYRPEQPATGETVLQSTLFRLRLTWLALLTFLLWLRQELLGVPLPGLWASPPPLTGPTRT